MERPIRPNFKFIEREIRNFATLNSTSAQELIDYSLWLEGRVSELEAQSTPEDK